MERVARELFSAEHGGAVLLPVVLSRKIRTQVCREIDEIVLERVERVYGCALQEFSWAPAPLERPACAEVFGGVASLCAEVGRYAGFSGVPNEVFVQRYDAGSLGITPHRDSRKYRNLTAIAVLEGSAPFYVGGQNTELIELRPSPGDIVLVRAPRSRAESSLRPVHAVGQCTEQRTVLIARYVSST